MISNQPRAAPDNRSTETRTSLNAVFRRLSDTPAPDAMPGAAPEPPPLPVPPAAPPPVRPPAELAAPPSAAERIGGAQVSAGAGPPARGSLAAGLLSRASAEIAAHPAPPTSPSRVVETVAPEPAAGPAPDPAPPAPPQGAAEAAPTPASAAPNPERDGSRSPENLAAAPPTAFRIGLAPGIGRIGAACPISAEAANPRALARQAGLPVAIAPAVLVEPQSDCERALALRRDDRPTMRNRRLYRRVGLEAEFAVNGVTAPLVDLSIGGFAAAGAPSVAPDAIVPITLRVTVDGVDLGTRLRARMVYSEPRHGNGGLAGEPRSGGRFVEVTPSQTTFLRYVVTRRGRAVIALGATPLLAAIASQPATADLAEATLPQPPQELPRDVPEVLPLPEGSGQRAPWWSRWFGRLVGSHRERGWSGEHG